MSTVDPETEKLLQDAEEVEMMLQGTAWGIVKGKLDAKILDLQNINNIDESNLAIDLKARMMASQMLFEWMKHDVYGFPEQQRANAKQLTIENKDSYIQHE